MQVSQWICFLCIPKLKSPLSSLLRLANLTKVNVCLVKPLDIKDHTMCAKPKAVLIVANPCVVLSSVRSENTNAKCDFRVLGCLGRQLKYIYNTTPQDHQLVTMGRIVYLDHPKSYAVYPIMSDMAKGNSQT